MVAKIKRVMDKVFDWIPPGELGLLVAPFVASCFLEAPWQVPFVFSGMMWLIYGVFTYLFSRLLPAKFRFTLRECATTPFTCFMDFVIMRLPHAVFELCVVDQPINQDKPQ